jgi:hypothetical protein
MYNFWFGHILVLYFSNDSVVGTVGNELTVGNEILVEK